MTSSQISENEATTNLLEPIGEHDKIRKFFPLKTVIPAAFLLMLAVS